MPFNRADDIWLASGLRTPFSKVDGPLASYDAISLSVPLVQQMLTRVRAEVVAATKGKQVPWSNSSLLGEVYLGEQ